MKHPLYTIFLDDDIKYRYTYEGGRNFIAKYLQKFSTREDDTAFTNRKNITYCPAFAKSAIDEIKNSIHQRLIDVKRLNVDSRYTELIRGANGGIDGKDASLNYFIGQDILPELLVMGKVGIFVDRKENLGPTLGDAEKSQPYCYIVRKEDIINWQYNRELVAVEFRCHEYSYDDDGFVDGKLTPVHKKFWKKGNTVYYQRGNEEPRTLGLKNIPFVILEISHSLLKDAADYQIALLNIESSDLSYILLANFPFYVEQTDSRISPAHFEQDKEAEVGTVHGRRYGKDLNAPSFIHPSSEPLQASMKKQEQLKNDIRLLVNLSLSTLKPQHSSAESKRQDMSSLESGLSNIGLVLQRAELQLAKHFHMYWGIDTNIEIKYPDKYSLSTESERQEKSKIIIEMMDKVPSITYKKTLAKELAVTLLEHKITTDELNEIFKEIDSKDVILAHETIQRDIELGVCSKKYAGEIIGYPANVVTDADKEHADRLARLQAAQSADKPGDLSTGDEDNKTGSQDSSMDENSESRTRGEE